MHHGPKAKTPETETLFEEIERYLAAIDLFRVEGCPPRWEAETADPRAETAVTR